MKKRKKLTSKGSKKLFKATANRTHQFNVQSPTQTVMRGGIRM